MHFGDVEIKNRPRLDMELRTYDGKKADIISRAGNTPNPLQMLRGKCRGKGRGSAAAQLCHIGVMTGSWTVTRNPAVRRSECPAKDHSTRRFGVRHLVQMVFSRPPSERVQFVFRFSKVTGVVCRTRPIKNPPALSASGSKQTCVRWHLVNCIL